MSKILVVGDAMIDVYTHGSVNRINPEAPCVLFDVHENEEFVQVGGALNVAKILALEGEDVTFLGFWNMRLEDLAGDIKYFLSVGS